MGSRYLVIFLGWLSVTLGVIGIFLPLLPTTPFILLAAWCFSRSSPVFHSWLLNHPRLGPIVSDWHGEGIQPGVRNRIILVMWLSLLLSMILIGKIWSVVLLLTIGASVTIYIMKKTITVDHG